MNLRYSLVPSFESGFVFGKVQRLTHNFVALFAWRSFTVRMLASASTTAVATVQKAPVMACAPILCILVIKVMPWYPQASLYTFEA
jgi:hypothetical protein